MKLFFLPNNLEKLFLCPNFASTQNVCLAMSCRYDHILNDYQRNVRAVVSQNGVLEEVNGNYPYGGLLGAPATGVQARKYGGKELDRENGLDWYDSQARMYDPLIGRTPTQDPMYLLHFVCEFRS